MKTQNQESRIQNDHFRVFELCTDKYIGSRAHNDLMALLKIENKVSEAIDVDIYFGHLKKLIEDFFIACSKWGFLPDVFLSGGISLFECYKFLSGVPQCGYKLDIPVFSKGVSNQIRRVLVCVPTSESPRLPEFHKLISETNSSYSMLSIVYQFMDVLLWFKRYTDEYNDIGLNKSRYKRFDSQTIISGLLEQDSEGNFHCGNGFLSYSHVRNNGYKVGCQIRAAKIGINTNEKTNQLYPNYIFSSERI